MPHLLDHVRIHHSPGPGERVKTTCPHCERPTFWVARPRNQNKRSRTPKPEGYLSAVLADGSCTTCWRERNNVIRPSQASGVVIHANTFRTPMTDAEMEIARRALARMALNRRRRGIPPEGVDPGWIRRRGLSLLEA